MKISLNNSQRIYTLNRLINWASLALFLVSFLYLACYVIPKAARELALLQ